MATLPKRIESPELHKAVISNVDRTQDNDPDFQLLLWPDGGLVIQSKVGFVASLEPKQVIELYQFMHSPRVQTRILDMLRRSLARSKAGRAFVKAFDTILRNDQPPAGAC